MGLEYPIRITREVPPKQKGLNEENSTLMESIVFDYEL
jgi:hypothetical protein